MAVLLASGAVALGGCGGSSTESTPTAQPSAATAAPAPISGGIPRIVERVQPQVVTVLTRGGLGSGVIYRADGITLTN
jgi:hypothetical protein